MNKSGLHTSQRSSHLTAQNAYNILPTPMRVANANKTRTAKSIQLTYTPSRSGATFPRRSLRMVVYILSDLRHWRLSRYSIKTRDQTWFYSQEKRQRPAKFENCPQRRKRKLLTVLDTTQVATFLSKRQLDHSWHDKDRDEMRVSSRLWRRQTHAVFVTTNKLQFLFAQLAIGTCGDDVITRPTNLTSPRRRVSNATQNATI